MTAVPRITLLPNLSDANKDLYGNRIPAAAAPYYQLLEAPKHEVNEDLLVSIRLEPPPEFVPESSSEALVIVADSDQHRGVRSIMSPKVCKCLMWLQVFTTALIFLIWCVAKLQ